MSDLVCKLVEEEIDKRRFLSLPNSIYEEGKLPNNRETEYELVHSKHILSSDFSIYPYIVYKENCENIPLSRAALFVYPDDEVGYIGLYETRYNDKAISLLFRTIEFKAKELGLKKLVGPIDGSIWIKYRFKVDNFNREPYTCEPYNRKGYKVNWEDNGYKVCEEYVSNYMRVPTECPEKEDKLLERFKKRGYEILTLRDKKFNVVIEEIYDLMIRLYSGFPMFKNITKEQFLNLYNPLSRILNPDMVFLAYKDGVLKGFSISLPNYSNLINDLSLMNLIKIRNIKKHSKEFVVLYLGADSDSFGLGVVLAILNQRYFVEHKCTSISALIHKGNTPEKYYSDMVSCQSNYVLLSKELK